MSNAAKLLQDQKNLIPMNSPVPNRRILIVDDEPEIAAGIERVLCPADSNVVALKSSRGGGAQSSEKAPTKNEFDVVVVNNPQDALKEFKKSIDERRPFAMGFFDVMLGADIDGIELVKQIMELDSRVFAVFVTAYHDRTVDTIGNYLGVENRERWDYINKPFSDGEILQKARNATSLWDLHRLKEWQAERLSEAHQLLLESERQNTVAAVGRSVAHEFGNLLTHIIGHAELAKDSESLEEVKTSMEVILKAGQTASSVLKNFRKINDNSESYEEFQKTEIHKIVEEALELMEFRFRRHSIKVIKEKLDSVEAEVNRNSLIQVLTNLFINAIHAMPEGGSLSVSLERGEKDFVLQVRDTGGGIPEDILPKVKEPMFSTKGSGGSGLGLAISNEIVEIEHHGEFSIENHKQGGAQMTLTIPLQREN